MIGIGQPATRVAARARQRVMRRREGERLLRARFRDITGRELDLDEPRTFTEKLYWRMITQQRRHDPRLTELTDKYRVRRYVREVVGEDYLVPLYWHGTDPDAIPFDLLPPSYVVKSNHGSSHVIRVSGDAQRDEVVEQARAWLRTNYYWTWREEQYYRIKPQVLVEELLDDGFTDGPLDYRFFCFGGEPVAIQMNDHVLALHVFYDLDWKPLDMRFRDGLSYEVPRPPGLEEMARVAAALSRPFGFVRVDLYNIRGDIRFGELTFTPAAGNRVFEPAAVERDLGERWILGCDRPGGLVDRRQRREQAR